MDAVRINRSTDAVVTVDMQTAFMPEHVWWHTPTYQHHLFDGGLPVKDGHLIVPVVQKVESMFELRYATLDQHPSGHISLASSYVGMEPGTLLYFAEVKDWVPHSGYVGSELPGVPHRISSHAMFQLSDLLMYLQEVRAQMLWPDHALIGTIEAELHPAFDWMGYRYVQTKGSDPKVDSYSGFHDNAGHETGLGARMKADGVENVFVQGLAEDFCVGWTAIGAKKLGFKNVYLVEDATKPVDLPGTRQKMRDDLAAAGVVIVNSAQLAIAL
jgi:nicotinamidase/pyrazinamidase